jgi:hypothetical protein
MASKSSAPLAEVPFWLQRNRFKTGERTVGKEGKRKQHE